MRRHQPDGAPRDHIAERLHRHHSQRPGRDLRRRAPHRRHVRLPAPPDLVAGAVATAAPHSALVFALGCLLSHCTVLRYPSPVNSRSHRPCWAEIDLDAIAHNVRLLAARAAPARLFAIVKANAYGHGAVPIARAAIDAGAAGLGVVCVDEGEELRLTGIDAPILVLGYTQPSEAERIVELRLTPVVGSMQVALALSAAASARGVSQRIHLELESGLNRHGLPLDALVAFAERVRALPAIEVEGLFTHFAAAEEGDTAFTRAQYDALMETSARLPWIPVRHCAASASALNAPGMALDIVRAGLAIYGYEPAPGIAGDLELRPALSLRARVARVIDVEPGGTVGYGRTWTAARPSRIALIMCGYADGYRRALSNKSSVLVRGQRAPIAGRIAMDMCMADVTDIPGVVEGDEAVLIGEQDGARRDGDRIDADELAELADTISWEILAGISARVPRLYLRGGEVTATTDLNHRQPEPEAATRAV
ncbi:MAG: alanine racemase [Chloroflexi bacterium]|nr:alanine racemase [Chloroflexota bacterium]